MRENYGTHGMNPLTDYVWQNVLGISAEDEFASDDMGNGIALVGKRIIRWDNAGFAAISRYPSATLARVKFDRLSLDYYTEDGE